MTRHAAHCLLILTALCSGCAAPHIQGPSAPVVILPVMCPRPAPPSLPKLGSVNLLESREGYAILKLRDQKIRAYIKGLNAALDCYDGQTIPLQTPSPKEAHDPQ